MGVEDRAAGVAQGVHRAEPLLEGGRAHGGRDLHAGAGGEVRPVRDRVGERLADEAHALEGDPLRDRGPDTHAGKGPGTGGERDGVEFARARAGGRQQRVDHLEHEGVVPPRCDTRVLVQARSVGKRYRARGAGGLDG